MGGHHDAHHRPAVPEPPYAKLLAPKSGLCPPDFHYARGTLLACLCLLISTSGDLHRASPNNIYSLLARAEVWYPHGGFYPDPKGWRGNLALAMGWVLFLSANAI